MDQHNDPPLPQEDGLPFLEVLQLLNESSEAFVYLHNAVGRFLPVSPGVSKITGYSQEETFQSFLRTCPIPLVIYNFEGRVRYLNPAFEQTFGWRLPELSGQKIPFVPESEMEATREGIRKVLRGEVLQDFETIRLTKSEALLNISLTSFRYLDEGGTQAGITVMLRDVTGKRNLEMDYRTELLTKDGTALPMRLSGSLLYEGDREMGRVGFFHDLTQQKTLETVLTREKAIMVELVNGIPSRPSSWTGIPG